MELSQLHLPDIIIMLSNAIVGHDLKRASSILSLQINFEPYSYMLIRSAMVHDVEILKMLLNDPRFNIDKYDDIIYLVNFKRVKPEAFDLVINHPKINKQILEDYLPSILIHGNYDHFLNKLLDRPDLKINLNLLLLKSIVNKGVKDDTINIIASKLGKLDYEIIYKLYQYNRRDLVKTLLNSKKITINHSNYLFCFSHFPDDIIVEIIDSKKFNDSFSNLEVIISLCIDNRMKILLKLIREKIIDHKLILIVIKYVPSEIFLEIFNELHESDIKQIPNELMLISIKFDIPEVTRKLLKVNNFNQEDLNIFFETSFAARKLKSLVEIFSKFRNDERQLKKYLYFCMGDCKTFSILLESFTIEMRIIEFLFLKSATRLLLIDSFKLLYEKYKFDKSIYNRVLLLSIYLDNPGIFKILANDKKIDCEKGNLALELACHYNNIEILKELLKDPEIDPSIDNNKYFYLGGVLARSELIKDERVYKRLINSNSAIMYAKKRKISE